MGIHMSFCKYTILYFKVTEIFGRAHLSFARSHMPNVGADRRENSKSDA